MRRILLFLVGFIPILLFAQIKPIDTKKADIFDIMSSVGAVERAGKDSVPWIYYKNEVNAISQPAIFINGNFVNHSILSTIDHQLIDSISVVRNEIEINGKIFSSQLFIEMKSDYQPQIISLQNLQSKYLKTSESPVLFMIDDTFVKDSFSQYLVDENFILGISVEKINNEKINIDLVRISTKKQENIDKQKTIIRGFESSMLD